MAWWSPRALPEILEADENHLSAFLRPLLAQLYEQLRDLDTRIRGEEAQLHAVFKQQEACQRLAAIVAVTLGLVPHQHGTGGKVRLLGISKRCNRHLCTLLVHGACSVVQAVMSKDKSDARRRWIKRLVWSGATIGRWWRRQHQTREISSNNGCVGNTRPVARPVRSAPFKSIRPQRPSRPIGCSRRGARIFHRDGGYSNAQPKAG